jgi:hypothetical protein
LGKLAAATTPAAAVAAVPANRFRLLVMFRSSLAR